MTNASRPRCHRGDLLRAHAYETQRATTTIVTGGMLIHQSRARIIHTLMGRWGATETVRHFALIRRALVTVETRVLQT